MLVHPSGSKYLISPDFFVKIYMLAHHSGLKSLISPDGVLVKIYKCCHISSGFPYLICPEDYFSLDLLFDWKIVFLLLPCVYITLGRQILWSFYILLFLPLSEGYYSI